MSLKRFHKLTAVMAVLTLAFSFVAVDYAEARRGGSFGSRGARTYQSAPATNTAPSAAPVQRSMTSPQRTAPAAGAAAGATRRPGFFGQGFGGALMRGLLIGGLFGLLMGQGFGGLAGMLGLIVQVLLVVGLIALAMRFFRRRQQPAMAGQAPGQNGRQPNMFEAMNMRRDANQPSSGQPSYAMGGGSRGSTAPSTGGDELGITPADLDIFENRLKTLQAAFSREDYAALREITTPEVMSYLSEELGQNASKGVRTESRDVELLQGDVAESWREGSRDYATVAMRYSMIEVTYDRQSGRLVDGSETDRVESTEVWTFIRDFKDEWKLSAIQEA